jgi:thiol-disulfide isomerase/thioredoxin
MAMNNTLQDISPYYDPRREFFHSYYEKALPYLEYLDHAPQTHREKWNTMYEKVSPGAHEIAIIKSFKRILHLLVLSGSWCGDCVRQGPMLRKIEEASPLIKVRFIDNKTYPELTNELRINGAEKVPVVVSLSEDFLELGRFGDRHLSVYRTHAYEAEKSNTGAFCDTGIIPPASDPLSYEFNEWVTYIERNQHLLYLSPLLRKRYND